MVNRQAYFSGLAYAVVHESIVVGCLRFCVYVGYPMSFVADMLMFVVFGTAGDIVITLLNRRHPGLWMTGLPALLTLTL